ncbi:MAG: lamin tail domain-containing protein [bacterium]|nr:lamin tail domain-containing protein [bacterium]
MDKSLKTGNSTAEGIVILAVLIVIMFINIKGTSSPTVNPPNPSNISETTNSSEDNTTTTISSYAQDISLSTGNASYTYQPYEEYISIYNRGRTPVNITNWQLKNSKDKRAYDLGGGSRYFPADTATIGQAASFISPSDLNKFQNIVLKPSETAIITTGSIGSQLPYKIVSFKENICSGYLEDLSEYAFTPALTYNCPRPADELGVSALDTECRRFIENMPSCRTPEFNTRNSLGDICYNCVDNKLLSSSCVAFIKNHFNYGSCITGHANDLNFSGRTWRVFLGRGWEMWADRYETISLLDPFGKLIIEESY